MFKKLLGAACLAAAIAFIPSASLAARMKKPGDPTATTDIQRNAPSRMNHFNAMGSRGHRMHHRRHHMKRHRRMHRAM